MSVLRWKAQFRYLTIRFSGKYMDIGSRRRQGELCGRASNKHIGGMRNAYKILAKKSEKKITLGRPRHR